LKPTTHVDTKKTQNSIHNNTNNLTYSLHQKVRLNCKITAVKCR